MKALFFHAEELVNRFHATAVQSKGSRARATGGEAQPEGNQAEKHYIARNCLNPLQHFKTLHRKVSSSRRHLPMGFFLPSGTQNLWL